MIIITTCLSNLVSIGDNTNQRLGLASPSNIFKFTLVPNSNGSYSKVTLGEKGGFAIGGTLSYITGQCALFDGITPSSAFQTSIYLSGSRAIDVSTSNTHAIALNKDGSVFTLGSNAYNQLARATTAPNSAGNATLPSWNEKILQVGAIKNLSFIFYPSAIFMIGKCESCLCGDDQTGQQKTGTLSNWTQFNLNGIDSVYIKRVYLGTQQFVLQMYNNKFYYIGKTEYGAGCGTKESYCTPHELPFTDAKHVFLSPKVTAIVTLTNQIKYCGCYNPSSCTNNTQLTVLNYSLGNKKFIHQVAQVGNQWYVIENDQTQKGVFALGNLNFQRAQYPSGIITPTAIAVYMSSAIAYNIFRYLNINFTGAPTPVNITICGNTTQQITSPYTLSIDLSYSLYPYGYNCIVEVTAPNIFPIRDALEFQDINITREYTIQQFPYPGIAFFTIYLKFQLENGNQISDSFTVEIFSITRNNSLVLNQSYVNAWSALQMSFNQTALYETYNISVSARIQQPPKYRDKTFIHEVTANNENITVVLIPIEEKYFFVSIQNTGNAASGAVIQFFYTNYTFRNNATTNSSGYITLTKLPTDPNTTGFNILYKYTGNGTYSNINYTYVWISFDVSTTTITLTPAGSYFTVQVTQGFPGTVTIISDTGTTLTTITFPTQGSNQYTQQVRIDPAWNQDGRQVTGRYSDPTGTNFAPDITVTLQNGAIFNFTVTLQNIKVRFTFIDQNSMPVPNHAIQISTDDKATNQTFYTNANGALNVTVNQVTLVGGVLWLWADASDGYNSFPEVPILQSDFQYRQEIQMYKFLIFNISINVLEKITGSQIAGINIQIFNSANPNVALLNGQTNNQGHVEFIVNETQNILMLRQNYILSATDTAGKLSQNNVSFFLQSVNIEIDVRMDAARISFQAIDQLTNQVAQGAALRIYIGQQKTNVVSDINGNFIVDVSGTFTQAQLFYKVLENSVYKPQSRQRFRYQFGVITLTVESWANMTLKITVIDGESSKPLDRMNVSVLSATGNLQFNQITGPNGVVWINCSERVGIINFHTVYNLSITDTLSRYSELNVNYSVTVEDQQNIIPLNLQRLLIIVTNYDAQRVGNVTIDVFSDGKLLQSEVSNALGITQYYLLQYDYVGKHLTYKIHQSEKYRPKGPLTIQIKSQPQQVIKRLFPLIIYNFTFNLTESQNESTVINLTAPHQQVLENEFLSNQSGELAEINKTKVKFNETLSNYLSQNNQDQSFQIQTYNNKLSDVQLFNFSLMFYDNRGYMVFHTYIYEIYEPMTLIFVENINLTFRNNIKYKFKIIDNMKVFQPISGSFRNMQLERDFNFQLKKMPSQKFQIPWWGYIIFICGISSISFLIYAIKRLVNIKKQFRAVYQSNGILLNQSSYEHDEQEYIKEQTDKLNPLRTQQEQNGHVIARQKLMQDNLTKYEEIQANDHNIIENAQILLKAKLQHVKLIQ